MKLAAHILTTAGKRLRSATIETDSPGLDRPTIHAAEQFARQWAKDNDHRILSDIVSQGEYRVWVEPLPAKRAQTLRQLRETNERIAAASASEPSTYSDTISDGGMDPRDRNITAYYTDRNNGAHAAKAP